MAPSRLPRTSAVLLAATLVATSSAIEFGGQDDTTQTAGVVAPAGETPTTNAVTGASGFGNFDNPTQWTPPSSNEVPTTAPTVTSSGSGWSQLSIPPVYSASSGGSGPSQTWTPPSGWTPPTAGGGGWTQPSGSGNQGWAPSSQGSGTAGQAWSQQTDTSSNAAPPSTGDSSGHEDTLGVDCSSSSDGGAYDMSLECSGSDDEGGESPGYDMSLECSGSDEEPPATGDSSNTIATTVPTVSSGTGDHESSSNTATSAPSIEDSTPATSSTSSGTGDQDPFQPPTSSASSSNTELASNTAQSATQEGSDATQTDTKATSGEHASFGKVTSKPSGCVIGDPEKYISTKDVNWIFENRMGVNQTSNKNWIFDHIVANKGSLNYCVRWDSTEKLSKTVASKFQAMLERQYAAWNRWLIGYGCWPYNEIKVNVVGFAVKEASLLDWTDDSLGTIYAGDLDDTGAPRCPKTCYKFFDNAPKTWTDTSGCKGEPFDLTLWSKQGLGGGLGSDWGQEVNLDNMLQMIDEEQLHIVAHEIGHGFGLPDFYEAADKPSTDMAPALMMAGSSMTVTDSDGWMLRRAYESIRDRYSFQ